MSSIKDIIRNNYWGKYFISCYHCIMCKLMPLLVTDEKAVKKFYKVTTGKELDLNNPQTFSEKMNWYKLNGRMPLMAQCADKVAVRDYIIEKGYSECLNEIIGIYNRVQDIDYNSLPDQFVIKAAHGSHMNYIVKDKSSFDWKRAKRMMKTWLHQDIYWSGREWVYKDIPKRIIIEKYLEDETEELRDYKFFCFNGKPKYLQIDVGRNAVHYRNYYDMSFAFLHLRDDVPSDERIVHEKPVMFDEMKKIAADLASPFQMARVDFYQVNNKVYFGEITFFHNGGITWFLPEEYDLVFGRNWKLVE